MANLDILTQPAPAAAITWKLQSRSKDKKTGQLVAYLDGQYYEDRLDEAVSRGDLDAWSETTELIGKVEGEIAARCLLTLKIGDATLTRTGIGSAAIGGGAQASLTKSAATDAFKRACARAGLGRFLYSLPILRAPLDEYGNLSRETKAALPGLTLRIMQAFNDHQSPEDLERQFAWALTRPQGGQQAAPQPDVLAEARRHLTQAEERVRKAGKVTELAAVIRDHPHRLQTVEAARAAYRAISALAS